METTQDEAGIESSGMPQVGDIVLVRGHKCRVFKVHPMGTVDVESLDSGHAWRICGAPLVRA